MAKKIFVSYRADSEGTLYKNLLVAWSKNNGNHFDIKFYDTSVGVSINSEDANYIKRVIKQRIEDSQTVLCIVGDNTASSDWVNWELEKAVELNKNIVAVKISNSYTSPLKLLNIGATWARSFTYESIKKAIDG